MAHQPVTPAVVLSESSSWCTKDDDPQYNTAGAHRVVSEVVQYTSSPGVHAILSPHGVDMLRVWCGIMVTQ